MSKPTLLILAAGMGSRYGGLKQIDPMGPNGESVLDYSIFDALRAGFQDIVFVIRRDILDPFRATVGARWENRANVRYAFQELTDIPEPFAVPADRAKPWGTAHAIRAARTVIDAPFAAINADDFYGADAFRVLSAFLSAPDAAPTAHAMAAFRLDQTLSANGTVSRGVCLSHGDNLLSGIQEHTQVLRDPATGALVDQAAPDAHLTGAEPVSMNCWGFRPSIFDELESAFRDFLASPAAASPKAEFTIPAVIDGMIRGGRGTVALLPTTSRWFGVTYHDDKPLVQAAIGELVASGQYPSPLVG
jgi:dTDP-glucose pyrophosphorylase